MYIRMLTIFIVFVCLCTACSEKNQLKVEQQSFVRWYEKENELEVYAVVSNSTKHDVSFQASFVFINESLKEAVKEEVEPLKTDDRNNNSPFLLKANQETVFQRIFQTHNKLTQEMLSEGIGLQIVDQQKTYTLAIKYVEIKKSKDIDSH